MSVVILAKASVTTKQKVEQGDIIKSRQGIFLVAQTESEKLQLISIQRNMSMGDIGNRWSSSKFGMSETFESVTNLYALTDAELIKCNTYDLQLQY